MECNGGDSESQSYYKLVTVEDMLNGSEWLIRLDKEETDMKGKFDLLMTAIECPEEYMAVFMELIKIIEKTAKSHFKNQNIHVYGFGSYITQLALKNCDLDMFLQMGKTGNDTAKELLRVRKMLYNELGSMFPHHIILIRASVPILKCRHEIGFECDISLNNSEVLYNSELIKFFLSLDPSFRSFVMSVKFWMKRQGLIGTAAFSSYSAVLLAVFYLQTKKSLPSVYDLQTSPICPPPVMVNSWNVSFSREMYDTGPQMSIIDHLTGFFEFYSAYEFGFHIISTFLGCSVRRPFVSPDDRFELYNKKTFKNKHLLPIHTYICIQDPFDHAFNTCKNTNRNAAIHFQSSCQIAHEILLKNDSSLLHDLFLPLENTCQTLLKSNRVVIVVGKVVLPTISESEQRNIWALWVRKAVEDVMVSIFACTVKKREEDRTTYEATQAVMMKSVRSQVPMPTEKMSPYETQKAITQTIRNSEKGAPPISLEFNVDVNLNTTPTFITIAMNTENDKCQYYPILVSLVRKHLATWVEDLLTIRHGENTANGTIKSP